VQRPWGGTHLLCRRSRKCSWGREGVVGRRHSLQSHVGPHETLPFQRANPYCEYVMGPKDRLLFGCYGYPVAAVLVVNWSIKADAGRLRRPHGR
jgi:hypothetical protein